jgi:hypothetical protein
MERKKKKEEIYFSFMAKSLQIIHVHTKSKIIPFTKPCDMLLKNWKLYLKYGFARRNEIERDRDKKRAGQRDKTERKRKLKREVSCHTIQCI